MNPEPKLPLVSRWRAVAAPASAPSRSYSGCRIAAQWYPENIQVLPRALMPNDVSELRHQVI